MTLDKECMSAYGATELKSILDTRINKPSMLQGTINSHEACMFYIRLLFLGERQGVAGAGLVLKEQELFYVVNLPGSALIPCGRIVFKN